MATLATLFNLAGRQTEGLLESIFTLMELELPVPDHSILSRRLSKLNIEIPVVPPRRPRGHASSRRLYRGKSVWRGRIENKSSWYKQTSDMA